MNNLYISLSMINTSHKPHSSTLVHKVAHTNPIPHVNFMFTISIQMICKHTLEQGSGDEISTPMKISEYKSLDKNRCNFNLNSIPGLLLL